MKFRFLSWELENAYRRYSWQDYRTADRMVKRVITYAVKEKDVGEGK